MDNCLLFHFISQKLCCSFSVILYRMVKKSICFFWSSQATTHWLYNGSGNNKLAFSVAFNDAVFYKQNQRLKRNCLKKRRKKMHIKTTAENMPAHRNQHFKLYPYTAYPVSVKPKNRSWCEKDFIKKNAYCRYCPFSVEQK